MFRLDQTYFSILIRIRPKHPDLTLKIIIIFSANLTEMYGGTINFSREYLFEYTYQEAKVSCRKYCTICLNNYVQNQVNFFVLLYFGQNGRDKFHFLLFIEELCYQKQELDGQYKVDHLFYGHTANVFFSSTSLDASVW